MCFEKKTTSTLQGNTLWSVIWFRNAWWAVVAWWDWQVWTHNQFWSNQIVAQELYLNDRRKKRGQFYRMIETTDLIHILKSRSIWKWKILRYFCIGTKLPYIYTLSDGTKHLGKNWIKGNWLFRVFCPSKALLNNNPTCQCYVKLRINQ